MRVIVFGASGKTGSLVIEKALAAGHAVTAFTREGGNAPPPTARVVTGDATDAEAVRRALVEQDAVIDTIGGTTPWKDSGLETSTGKAIIAGMKAEGVRRLIVVSAMGVGESTDQASFFYGHVLMPTLMRGVVKDKGRLEDEVDASGLDFVIARPAALSDEPEDGTLRVVPGPEKAHETRRGDLARFLVDQLTTDAHLNQAVVVANS